MDSRIKDGQEYRAVVETIEFRQFLIAKGSYEYVTNQLENWLENNPLVPGQTALIVHVVHMTPGPEFPMMVLGHAVE